MQRTLARGTHFIVACLFAAVAAALSSSAFAAPPWQTLVPFKKIECDPNSSYPVSQENGPWMIMATTFRGEAAQQQAHELVQELRRKHKLNAYTYSKAFDFTQHERGLGLDKYGRPKQMRYMKEQVVNEVAVLVGDYDTVDNSAAQKDLERLKFLSAESVAKSSDANKDTLGSFRQFQRDWMQKNWSAAGDNRKKGPLGQAFIATNPLLPPEYFQAKGVDKLVLEINKGVEHSLLDCPGKYSVRVATFYGANYINPRQIEEVESGKKSESRLAEAGEKAHRLTEELRKKGWEAYEFHDRHSSMVCVGNFQSVGMPRADGKIEIDPTIHKIIQTFGPDPEATQRNGKIEPRKIPVARIAGEPRDPRISLDIQPIPVEVPKRSISADYQHSMRME